MASKKTTEPGISIQFGPASGAENGVNGKRKSRGSIAKPVYRDDSSDDDVPLVC
jgi:hypothetical protein